MSYVSFFITSVPKERVEDYKLLADIMAKKWLEHGALEVQEFIGDEVPYGEVTSYPRAVQAGEGEVIITGFIRFKSKDDPKPIMEKVMSDEKLMEMFKDAPMDGKKMIFGDFIPLIEMK